MGALVSECLGKGVEFKDCWRVYDLSSCTIGFSSHGFMERREVAPAVPRVIQDRSGRNTKMRPKRPVRLQVWICCRELKESVTRVGVSISHLKFLRLRCRSATALAAGL